ncbi:replicative DNA helicase [Paenibacillus tarimensis]
MDGLEYIDDIEYAQGIEAEQAVLGSILVAAEAYDTVDEILRGDELVDGRHQRIYRAMRNLRDEGTPVDLVTLTGYLQNSKELAEIGGVSYLAQLQSGVPTASNVAYYAGIVSEQHIKRMTLITIHEQMEQAKRAGNATKVIDNLQAAASALSDRAAKPREFKTTGDAAREAFEQIEVRYNNRNESNVTGIPSGYSDLDRMTSGFQKSDLIIVAARPSVGKTAFALNVAQNAGVREKKNVGIFSLEMSAGQLAQRMMSSEQNIDASRLRTGYLEGDDWEKLTMAVGALADANIFIDDSPVITAQEIAGKCRRLKKTHGLDMILIDYLQLIAGRGRRENRQQEVTEISRTLKQIARELDVPVIALSQLSRAVEQRQDKRPMMSDLRESGAIEQDADIVAFLYRDDYYDKESEKKNIIEIIIAKQRNGPVGTVELAFLKNYNKFVSLDRSHQDSQPKPQQTPSRVPDMYRQRA